MSKLIKNYVLSFEIKERYIKDQKLLNSILKLVSHKKYNNAITKEIIKAFEVNEELLKQLQEFGEFDTSKILKFVNNLGK